MFRDIASREIIVNGRADGRTDGRPDSTSISLPAVVVSLVRYAFLLGIFGDF